MASEKDEPEVFKRGTLAVKVERSEKRGRVFVTVNDQIHGLTAEEMEALGRFLVNSARRLSR